MKNYRVQDGCWNCSHAHVVWWNDSQPDYSCMLTTDDVEAYGICDLYEKEDE